MFQLYNGETAIQSKFPAAMDIIRVHVLYASKYLMIFTSNED